MDEYSFEKLIKNLKNPDMAIKSHSLNKLRKISKNAGDLQPAISALKDFLLDSNLSIWKKAYKCLRYYYQNYISFYCRNLGSFFTEIKNLSNSAKTSRKAAFQSLQTYPKLSKPREWKYFEKDERISIMKDLRNKNYQKKLNAISRLNDAIQNNVELFEFYTELINHLQDDKQELRWKCADLLEKYIGKYTQTSYSYTLQYIRDFDPKDKINYAKTMSYAASYDLVSDRDERDISFALPRLMLLLLDEDAEIRRAGIKALIVAQGEHDLTFMVPFLIQVLTDSTKKNIHQECAQIFRKLIEDGFNISGYAKPLLKVFDSNDNPETQKEIILILRKAVQEGYNIQHLLSFFEDLLTHKVEEIKFGAADTLAYYYCLKKNWKSLKQLMHHEDKDVRQEAVGTIEHIKSTLNLSPIIPEIINLLSDEDKEVRFVTARSLLQKYSSIHDLESVIPLMASFAREKTRKLRNDALKIIIKWINDNITCRSTINPSQYDLIKPFIKVLEDQLNYKNKTEVAEPLTQFYSHSGQFEKIKRLLKKNTIKMKKDILFRLTTCGWSDCNVDLSALIPSLLELYFKEKNKRLRDNSLSKLEEIVNAEQATEILEDIQKYPINERWKLEDKLRKVARLDEIRQIKKKMNRLSESKKCELLKKLLKDNDTMLQSYATQELWNFLYKEEKDYLRSNVDQLSVNLNSTDPHLKEVSASLLGGFARKRIDISQAIITLGGLLSNKSIKVRLSAASALATAAEKDQDISAVIPDLIQKFNDDINDIRYFSTLAIRNYVNSPEKAQLVLNQLEGKNLNRKDKEVNRLKEKCEALLK
jgi:HEAT repeat protein